MQKICLNMSILKEMIGSPSDMMSRHIHYQLYIAPLNRQSKQKIPTNCLFVYFFAFFRESDVISRIAGLLSWDVASCHVDLGKELDIITSVAPPGEECRGGTYFFLYLLILCMFF